MTDIADHDSLLADRFAALAIPDPGDWVGVRRRARRMQMRRIALLAAALIVAALAATPALGIGGRLLDVIQGPPAPSEVQRYFAANDAVRERLFAYAETAGEQLHDRFSRVIPGDARGVFAIESPDGPIYLWTAPTEDGRQCWLVQTGAEPATGRPYGEGSCDSTDETASIRPEYGWTALRPSVKIVHVRVYDSALTHVDVESENAPVLSLRVVAGHALGTLQTDAKVLAFVGRNADDDPVAKVKLHPSAG